MGSDWLLFWGLVVLIMLVLLAAGALAFAVWDEVALYFRVVWAWMQEKIRGR